MLLTLNRLADPIVEQVGHPVDARYCEVFWLPVLGPTCLWLLRHAAAHTARSPYVVDAEVLGKCLGIGGVGTHSPLMKSFARLAQFDCATQDERDSWLLRTHLAPLAARQTARLPEVLRTDHARYVAAQLRRPVAVAS